MKNKVVIIGLDGATWDVLTPLMARGEMPTLRRLAEEGASGTLKSTTPPMTPTACVTLYTGVNPGKHGIIGFENLPKDGQTELVNSTSWRYKTIWQILSENGRRSILVGLPLTYPPQEINGIVGLIYVLLRAL